VISSLQAFQQKFCTHFLSAPCVLHASSISSSLSWSSLNYEAPRYGTFSSPVTLSLLGPDILLSILFSNTHNLCSYLNVKDRVSHSYKTRGNIILLNILIFTFPYGLIYLIFHHTVSLLNNHKMYSNYNNLKYSILSGAHNSGYGEWHPRGTWATQCPGL
jgi:hypothetical protein